MPIAYTDIIPTATTTLTDANNSILDVPKVYYVDGSSGSETELTGTAMDLTQVKPEYDNYWRQRFTIKTDTVTAITAN